MNHKHLITFSSVMVVAWVVGTFLFIYFWPHLVTNHFKRAIVDQGFGDGPIPINTLYSEPQKLFGDPLHTSLPPGSSNSMTVGVNHDTLLTVGWLDLSKGPRVLQVPNFSGRYYSVQFTDPFDVDFAYVGTRTTGTQAGDYLIAGPGWQGWYRREWLRFLRRAIPCLSSGGCSLRATTTSRPLMHLRNKFRSSHLPFANPASNVRAVSERGNEHRKEPNRPIRRFFARSKLATMSLN